MTRFLLLFALLIHVYTAHAATPEVSASYSPTWDAACALVRGGAIAEPWKAELTARLPEFDALWASAGPGLIETTERLAGKPFPTGPHAAHLTLCNLPSQSIVGLVVNMRYALQSFTPTPVTLRYKVDTLFYELLHVFLARHPVSRSALLASAASEPECVRNHLHLLALQKAVLIERGETAALQEVMTTDARLPGGCYQRAWDIVNAEPDTYRRLVAEIVQAD